MSEFTPDKLNKSSPALPDKLEKSLDKLINTADKSLDKLNNTPQAAKASPVSLDNLKKTHNQLAYIHQILTQRTQFNIEEFDIAKDCAATITDMANRLADEIKGRTEANEAATPTEALTAVI